MRFGTRKMVARIVLLGSLAALSPFTSLPQPRRTAPVYPPPEMRVDVNHASVEELLKVPGMTRSWAERIVRFRPYRTKEDLTDLGVMPGAVYERIKNYIIAHRAKP